MADEKRPSLGAVGLRPRGPRQWQGGILGAAVGALGGPWGAIAGALIGAKLGQEADPNEC